MAEIDIVAALPQASTSLQNVPSLIDDAPGTSVMVVPSVGIAVTDGVDGARTSVASSVGMAVTNRAEGVSTAATPVVMNGVAAASDALMRMPVQIGADGLNGPSGASQSVLINVNVVAAQAARADTFTAADVRPFNGRAGRGFGALEVAAARSRLR